MQKNKILPTIVLSLICIVVALLLAVANMVTAPIIEDAQREKEAKVIRQVYPQSKSFKIVDLEKNKLPASITEAYVAEDGGFVFKSEVRGYKDGLVILVGVSADGRIVDSKFVESQETNGAESKLDGAYNGKSAEEAEAIIIASSTRTSEGYKKAISDALEAHGLLKGGIVK